MNGSLQLSDVVADSYRGPLASLVRGMRISRRHAGLGLFTVSCRFVFADSRLSSRSPTNKAPSGGGYHHY